MRHLIGIIGTVLIGVLVIKVLSGDTLTLDLVVNSFREVLVQVLSLIKIVVQPILDLV